MDIQERGLALLMESMNDLASAAKLQFSLSTGAVVLFVHSVSEFHRMPVRTGILTLAAFFFAFSSIQCIKAMILLAGIKGSVGASVWRDDVENRGDLFRERSKESLAAAQQRFARMDWFFYTGVALSVLFMIVQFAATIRA